jgi:hypothetical protein
MSNGSREDGDILDEIDDAFERAINYVRSSKGGFMSNESSQGGSQGGQNRG